jgi:anti-sigma B factor antagonist
MPIQKSQSGESIELMPAGRIDGAAANELEVEALAAMRDGIKAVYVNLSQATFLCSAALRVLLQHHRQFKKNGKTFLVTRPSPEVASAIEMTGFAGLVET